MTRRKLVAGNWKMNATHVAAAELIAGLRALLPRAPGAADVAVCPPFTALESAARALDGSGVALGAQNMSRHDDGAHTGEISAAMLAALGCRYVILGHSERRQHAGEDDALVSAKASRAIAAGLVPIVCVGETLAEREGGRTASRVEAQVRGSLAGVAPADAPGIVLAYEPIWAIGTGNTASPEQAEEVHRRIREVLGSIFGSDAAGSIRILYGGSVNPGNAGAIFAREGIDGGLIGGASLRADSFDAICRAAG